MSDEEKGIFNGYEILHVKAFKTKVKQYTKLAKLNFGDWNIESSPSLKSRELAYFANYYFDY